MQPVNDPVRSINVDLDLSEQSLVALSLLHRIDGKERNFHESRMDHGIIDAFKHGNGEVRLAESQMRRLSEGVSGLLEAIKNDGEVTLGFAVVDGTNIPALEKNQNALA